MNDLLSDECLPGLTAVDATRILHDELQRELSLYESHVRAQPWRKLLQNCFLHHAKADSVFLWTSGLIIIVCSILLIIAFGVEEHRHNWLVIEALLVLSLMTVCLYFLAWDDSLRHVEHVCKAKRVLAKLKSCIRDGLWDRSSYVDLNCPLSPCLTLQWTVRDGLVVNLPVGFLVEGDIIHLRPGQVIPVSCRELRKEVYEEEEELQEFKAGDVYHPLQEDEAELGSQLQARRPFTPRPFLVTETPFLKNFRQILHCSHIRPASVMDNDRHQVYHVWIERRILPIILAVTLMTNTLRYMLLGDRVGHWVEMFLVLQVHALLPLTALTVPVMWKLLDMYGIARVLCAFHLAKLDAEKSTESSEGSNSTLNETANLTLKPKDIWSEFKDIFIGVSDSLPRTCNILHALGSVTSFCCVDKKGVLSWPNPTAEKVSFLTNDSTDNSKRSSHYSAPSHVSEDIEVTEPAQVDQSRVLPASKDTSTRQELDYTTATSFQVLDLTQDTKNYYGLHFDDLAWKKHINSLKPLGLNILLNTCNVCVSDRYTQFADHVTCASLNQEATVPVMNRRCFCELAKQIGFEEPAVDIFSTQQVLGMYRQIPGDTPAKERLGRSKTFIKYRMPMPNLFSVVVKESTTGSLQMFSQGTADLLLDTCSDYWDGNDLCPLSKAERKKIADFYHRTSMSSYCTAFAYRPMTESIGSEFGSVYIEVPEGSSDLFPSLRSPTPSQSWDTQSLESRFKHLREFYHGSADSVMMGASSSSVHDTESCFRTQCNQIFIGMITMQYQAKQDIVDLIEDLESACIRFVHFSKENELRSRVFSEKMGLEAGWNCHISLLSQKAAAGEGNLSPSHPDLSQSGSSNRVSRYSSRHSTDSLPAQPSSKDQQGGATAKGKSSSVDAGRQRRSSAPAAISIETSQVKFETMPSPREVSATESSRERATATATAAADSQDLEMTVLNVSLSLAANQKDAVHADEDECNDVRRPLLHHQQQQHQQQQHQQQQQQQQQQQKNTLGTTMRNNQAKNVSTGNVCVAKEDTEAGVGFYGLDEDEDEDEEERSSVESFPASSYLTENTDSVTGGLGLSNRAKLPKGIENIRPHIENVDNVPLLVSLFTDCTPNTTKEMLQILQEYGEVVCAMGSSASIHNTHTFLQADCSLAVEPQYPQICMKQPSVGRRNWAATEHPTPMELSALMHSIPCALTFSSSEEIKVIQLIALARHHCQRMRNTFLFFLMCQISLTLVQIVGDAVLLPPVLSPHLLLWLVAVVIPTLSLTMMGNPLDLQIVKMAQGKNNQHVSRTAFLEFLLYYSLRFVPSLLVCLLCHAMTLGEFCRKVTITPHNSTSSPCHMLLGNREYEEAYTWSGWYGEYTAGLVLSQNLMAFQLVLYFVCMSLCYIHRLRHLWQKSPFSNKLWCAATPVLLVLQVIYFAADVTVMNNQGSIGFSLWDVPMATWVLALVWPFVLIPSQELVKRRETKLWVRYQKRARLDFGTKLGMNSPF